MQVFLTLRSVCIVTCLIQIVGKLVEEEEIDAAKIASRDARQRGRTILEQVMEEQEQAQLAEVVRLLKAKGKQSHNILKSMSSF